jgi:hypothetical protein
MKKVIVVIPDQSLLSLVKALSEMGVAEIRISDFNGTEPVKRAQARVDPLPGTTARVVMEAPQPDEALRASAFRAEDYPSNFDKKVKKSKTGRTKQPSKFPFMSKAQAREVILRRGVGGYTSEDLVQWSEEERVNYGGLKIAHSNMLKTGEVKGEPMDPNAHGRSPYLYTFTKVSRDMVKNTLKAKFA